MSKLYQMNRMRNSAAAGGLFSTFISKAGKIIGSLTRSKGVQAAVDFAKKNPGIVAGAGTAVAGTVAAELLKGGGSGGGSGSWTHRRRKGITATELRGFRKVAKLLHNEGMVIKKRRHA